MPTPSVMLPASLVRALDDALRTHAPTPDGRMRAVTDVYWRSFGAPAGPVSWCGFYTKPADADEMILVCREPKPACSPIGLHGMCGRGWKDRRGYVVRDVRVLGADYVACDPRDQSELVLPVFDVTSPGCPCLGVFDVDSFDLGAFSVHDATVAREMLRRAGLSGAGLEEGETVEL